MSVPSVSLRHARPLFSRDPRQDSREASGIGGSVGVSASDTRTAARSRRDRIAGGTGPQLLSAAGAGAAHSAGLAYGLYQSHRRGTQGNCRPAATAVVREEFARIECALDADLPEMGRGVAFFTCRRLGLWRQIALSVPYA